MKILITTIIIYSVPPLFQVDIVLSAFSHNNNNKSRQCIFIEYLLCAAHSVECFANDRIYSSRQHYVIDTIINPIL